MRLDVLLVIGAAFAGQSYAANEALLYQRFQLSDSGSAVFRPGEENILVVHGFDSSADDMLGVVQFARTQCANVITYSYPSGINIDALGRQLYNMLSERLALEGQPSTRFDIVAYSEGGLVSRVAIEPGPLNGGRAFGRQVGK